MSDVLVVLPVVAPITDTVIRGHVRGYDGSPVLLVDNTTDKAWATIAGQCGYRYLGAGRNLGVAASWNAGVVTANRLGLQFVACVSTSVPLRFADLERSVVEHADIERGLLTDQAFHVAVWSVDLFKRVGWFDPNFGSYFEDTDWVRRLWLAGEHTAENPMPKVPAPAAIETARSLRRGYVDKSVLAEARAYYRRKWGGSPGRERFDTPFNSGRSVAWWPRKGDPV